MHLPALYRYKGGSRIQQSSSCRVAVISNVLLVLPTLLAKQTYEQGPHLSIQIAGVALNLSNEWTQSKCAVGMDSWNTNSSANGAAWM